MQKKIVFIVEDNEMTSFSIEHKIRLDVELDLDIRHFTAVEKAIGETIDLPDLIILDHHLEQTSGIGCIPIFRAFSPSSYIIVYSKQEDITWFDKAFLLGADTYFQKSIDHKLLVAKVLEVLNREKEPVDTWYIQIVKNLVLHKSSAQKIKRVLIVEDNEMFALAVEQAFKESPFIHSEFYQTPDQFLSNIADPPDIYILDYNLNHELTGKDLLLEIKRVNPKAVVIILLAQKEVKIAVDLMLNGATYYLLKTRDNLRRLVKIIESL